MVGKITLNRIFGRICRPIRKLCAQNYYNNLKDIHKGKRGFVIGNGPSLKIEDLDNLNNEITIASNKIYLAFKETKWRPKFYTVADPILWPKIKNKILNYDLRSIHIPSYLDDIPLKMLNKVKVWRHNKRKKNCIQFSDDFSKKVYGGGTVTYQNLQLAFHLGLNPIYMIGCDHNYHENTNPSQSVVTSHGDKTNHFHKNYREKGEKVLSANIELMNESFNKAKSFFVDNKIEIYNSTRGGELDIFTRKDFQNLFKTSD